MYVAERSEQELVALFDVRSVIEAHVARRAAEYRRDDDLARLRVDVEVIHRTPLDEDGATAAGRSADFYATLRAGAHDGVLEATATSLGKRARFYFATLADDLGGDWLHTHEHLLDAVDRRAGDEAARLSREQIEETGRGRGAAGGRRRVTRARITRPGSRGPPLGPAPSRSG